MLRGFGRFASGVALVVAGAALAVGPMAASPGGAVTPATINVNDAGDAAPVPANCSLATEGDCTLRAALEDAATISGAVVINLPDPNGVPNNSGTVYTVLNGPNPQLGPLTLTAADSASSVSLQGVGAATSVIQGQCTGGTCTGLVLATPPGTLSISGVTVEHGTMYGNSGGGIDNSGTLTVSNSTISNNIANNSGGGVFNSGTLTLQNNTITGNQATSGGGVENDAVATLSGNTISNNTTYGSNGAGLDLCCGATTSLTNDVIEGNTAGNSSVGSNGGGVFIDGGTNTFTNVTISDNTAAWSSAANGLGGGVYIDSGTNTFTGGTISDNYAYAGGGVWGTYSSSPAAVNTFSQETIGDNTATEGGAGLGFMTLQHGTTAINASTITGNTVTPAIGTTSFVGDGGGILSASCNALTLTNDTITANRSNDGAGYYAIGCPGPSVSVALQFDTISNNIASDPSGAGNIQTDPTDASNTTVADTIVTGGTAGGSPKNCVLAGSGTVTSGGYNLVDDATCGSAATTDIIGKDPQLGALANNGGPTETELPADNSPAVGAIPDATCVGTGVSTDQRGVARGAGAASSCTIGAVEVGQNFNGYRLVADEGGIFDFGLLFSGSLANNHLNAPIVGLANAPGPAGYLMVGGDGGVFALGGAAFFGSLGGQAIASPIAAIAAPPTETGYWLVAQNGTTYHFGSVPALPSLQLPAGAHIVGMASTTDGQGAWMVDNLGDVYAEGSAQYEGGLGGVHINMPIVGIAAAASGQGYILVASDGGTFAYGTQKFFGSVPGSLTPGQSLVAPVVGIAVTHSGLGYWEVGADGGVFTYGDAPFLGSVYTAIGNHPLNGPIVGIQHLGSVAAPG